MMIARLMLTVGLMAGAWLATASTAAAGTVAVKSRTVDYKIGDQAFEGLFVYPQASKGKVPGVLMVHNWLGVSDETKRQAERVAKLGLAVFAVDVYGKGIRAKSPQEAMALAGKYKGDRKLFRERVLRGLEVLREQKEVDGAKVVAAGYCFGGTGVIELARAGADVQAVVSFHGGLDSPNPADGKNIKTKVVVLQGADDPFVKPADILAFQNEMRSHNVDWQMTVYGGAVHSFTDAGAGSDVKTGQAYNKNADERSFEVFTDLVHDIFPKR
jgi:dienelactone hydrolase